MANTHIDYNTQSIDSAFKDFYIVPDYQREYVWDEGQVEQLFNDLFEAYCSDNRKAYFLRTIVTCIVNGESGSKYELIDGQQRLTTFFILLCAIKQIYLENDEDVTPIQNLLYSKTYDDNGNAITLYHLALQYEDAGNSLELIEKGSDVPQQLTQSGEKLFGSYKTIRSSLKVTFPDIAEMKKFVVFLLKKTCFIRIETDDINDALKIFETINQRGKGLDPMDLLKNMIFRQVDRSKFKELNMNWRNITAALESIDEKPLRFLRYFIMANYDTSDVVDGILREDQIYKWLSDNGKQCLYKEQPFQFVQKMYENVRLYVGYRKPTDNANGNIHLKNIPMLAGSSYKLHLMLMLAASNMNNDALAKFKGVLESVVYYTVINRISTNVTERTFVSWCKGVREIRTAEQLDEFVASTIAPTVNQWKIDNESNFLRLGLKSMQQYRIKFILGKITAYVDALRSGQNAVGDLSPYTQYTTEIEHIMPQTCEQKDLYNITDEDYTIYLNRLGNLTLLENTLNKSIHNEPYAVKCEAYKKSKFYLTSSPPELVNQGQNTAINRTNELLIAWPKWNREAIDERQKMLYRLSEMIWSF